MAQAWFREPRALSHWSRQPLCRRSSPCFDHSADPAPRPTQKWRSSGEWSPPHSRTRDESYHPRSRLNAGTHRILPRVEHLHTPAGLLFVADRLNNLVAWRVFDWDRQTRDCPTESYPALRLPRRPDCPRFWAASGISFDSRAGTLLGYASTRFTLPSGWKRAERCNRDADESHGPAPRRR
jgi:hypothetical protein